MDWKNFVRDHKGERITRSFRPACSNSYFEGGESKTLYGMVRE